MRQLNVCQVRQPFRSGLSILEAIFGLAAVTGGLFMGTLYLGVDMQGASLVMLQSAGVQEPLIQWLGIEITDPESVEGQTASFESQGNFSLVDNTDNFSSESTLSKRTNRSLASTKVFWTQLNQAMRQEISERPRESKGQMLEFLTERQQLHEQTQEAIVSMGHPNTVDSRLLAYADQVMQWHQSGASLYREAVEMFPVTTASRWTGPFAQNWQSAVRQHRMEEKLLLAKHKSMLHYLNGQVNSQKRSANNR